MNYNLNINKLIDDTLPSFLRGEKQSSWLRSLTKPIAQLRDQFLGYVSTTNEKLKWSGQTISMENLLTERYGDGITISNQNLTGKPFYIYNSADTRNPKVYEVGNTLNPVADTPGAFDLEAVDFIVTVPALIILSDEDKDEMKALVNEYKIYSKRFKIEHLS